MWGSGRRTVLCVFLAILQAAIGATSYLSWTDIGKKEEFLKDGGTVDWASCALEEEITNKQYDDYPNLCYIENLPDTYKNEDQNCCNFDGIDITSQCVGKDGQGNEVEITNIQVCQYPNITTGKGHYIEKPKLECPPICEWKERKLDLKKPESFKIIDDNNIEINGKKYGDGFCLAHKCEAYEEGWEISAEVCDCNVGDYIEPKVKEFINEIKSMDGKVVKSCCGDRTPVKLNNHILDNCTDSPINNMPFCDIPRQSLVLKYGKNSTRTIINMNKKVQDESESCVGVTLDDMYVYAQCRTPCGGKKEPCLRRCCEPGQSWNVSGSCDNDDNPPDISYIFEPNFKYKEFTDRVKQSIGKIQLYSEDKCEEAQLKVKDGNLIYFNETSKKEIVYKPHQFCYSEVLGGKRQDGKRGSTFFEVIKTNQPEVTRTGMNGADKTLAYTIILAFSTILLFITIFIYVTHTALWKHYSKLMINFAASLFIANILLLMIWKAKLSDNCILLGLSLQFFFLATFTWMTIMSWEIFIQLKSSTLVNHANDHKRIAKQACIGYGFPLFMIIVTLIVELSAPMCAAYRPRFDVKNCGVFFGSTDKFLWLYGPILAMLLLNTGMMIFIFFSVYKQKAKREGSGSNRSQKYDMICLYLRLFLGMGFIWYFEILSWAVNPRDDGWMITDCLNMMQGTYVFFIFVCKRNVLGVVFGKKSRLYSMAHQTSVRFGKGGKQGLNAQGSLATEQSEMSQSMITDQANIHLNPSP